MPKNVKVKFLLRNVIVLLITFRIIKPQAMMAFLLNLENSRSGH